MVGSCPWNFRHARRHDAEPHRTDVGHRRRRAAQRPSAKVPSATIVSACESTPPGVEGSIIQPVRDDRGACAFTINAQPRGGLVSCLSHAGEHEAQDYVLEDTSEATTMW